MSDLELIETFQALADKYIFFGHQSVGYDIVKGIEEVQESLPLSERLRIVDIGNGTAITEPGFYHTSIGFNRKPETKIDSFFELLTSNKFPDGLDIAFFKLCYVDIHGGTDLEGLFRYYTSAMTGLGEQFPETVFIHVTTPLTVRPAGLRASVRTALFGDANNMARCQYNELIRSRYQDKEPFLDLARIESTFPDGKKLTHRSKGVDHGSLVLGYTHDGGHLNETGRKLAAKELLRILSAVT